MAVCIPDIIAKKRDGLQLTNDEMDFFIKSVVEQNIEGSQIGAMLMAFYLNGLTRSETVQLTYSMTMSGETLSFPEEWAPLLVDKHSTGGVGDKISLVLAPALAALGFKVPMVSGRGLGFTGGTLDKLESIKGFKTSLSNEEMKKCLDNTGCFIAGATSSLAPADGVLYKQRDVTNTVGCKPLIVSSILSKKVAEGTKALVMDIKVGTGAMLKTEADARELAEMMISISKGLGVETKAVLSRMDSPIGRTVGNSLEVWEAIQCLRNEGPADVMDLVLTLGAVLLLTKGKTDTLENGKRIVDSVIKDGKALTCFESMLQDQGVSSTLANALCRHNSYYELPISSKTKSIAAQKTGYISELNALTLGTCCWHLGAGRTKPSDPVDHTVGLHLLKTVGDHVQQGDPIMVVHHFTPTLPQQMENQLRDAVVISDEQPKLPNAIICIL